MRLSVTHLHKKVKRSVRANCPETTETRMAQRQERAYEHDMGATATIIIIVVVVEVVQGILLTGSC